MILLKLCRNILLRSLVVLAIISSLLVPPAFSQETEDSQVFIAGFNAYQQRDYGSAIEKMNEVLQKYPDTPLRDMALFWLARAYYKSGNQQEAARFLSQFSKEYPDNPLKGTVEDELTALVARYEKGEKLPVGAPPVKVAERQAALRAKAEKERLAREKLEQERLGKEKAEQERQAKLKAEQERQAQEKLAQAKAEQERIAALKADEARKAAEKAEQERIAQQKAEEARQAAAAAEQSRVAAARKEAERLAAEKAEQERLAQEKALAERQAAEKAELERQAGLKAEQQRLEREKAEQVRIAAIKLEEERQAALKAEQERQAREKAEQERAVAAKAEQERLAAEKAEQERLAKARAEQERLAAARAEQERLAAETREKERIAAAKAAEEMAAKQKAEEQRVAAARAEEARVAAEKAEIDRLAALRIEEEREAAVAAEQSRVVAARKEAERLAAEKAAAEAEAARVAAARAEEDRQAQARAAEEKARQEKLALREKAIAQYKSIIERYPATAAATAAAAKLRELGLAVAVPAQPAVAEQLPENAQVLRLEVAQFAGFEFNLLSRPEAFVVGQRVSIPFEITNRGNGSDSFQLESGFPASFGATFAAAASPDQTITQTPALAPGDVFRGVVHLAIPTSSIDGLRITHPVKALSRFMNEATQSREVVMTASAPLLRAVVKTEKTQPLPGEKVVYRIAVLNVGSTTAQDVTFRLNYPPQLEPLDHVAAGFRIDGASLRFDGLQVKSGESREFSVSFQLKGDSMAGQEISTRAELVNNPLKTSAAFMSNVAYVKPQYGIQVRTVADRRTIIPGQTVTIPFVVTNAGNVREKFKVASSVRGVQEAVVFLDLNRDGIRQASEPVVSEIGPLSPREEVNVVMEVKTPRSAADGTDGSVQVSFVSEGDGQQVASGTAQLLYSRPVLKLAMAGQEGRLKPGEVAWFDLTIANNGSNLARVVELQSAWPEQLELVAAEPAVGSSNGGKIVWRFKELGAGEKRTIKVSFRVKPGTGVGTNIQVRNVMTYEDQLGNRY